MSQSLNFRVALISRFMGDQLISFLNSERLQQSRTIAKQLDLLGRQNRSIDQLRNSLKRSHTEDISKPLLLRLAAACERVERAGTCMSASELAGVFAMAINHLAGDVRVTHRRTRSLPPRAPLGQVRKRSRSAGDDPEGGLDIELLYYSNGENAGTPLSPLLSPGLSDFVEIAGVYATPSTFSVLTVEGSKFIGKWGGQPISVFFEVDGLFAIFDRTGFKIPGRLVTGGICWFGGQFWKRLSFEEIVKGKWLTNSSVITLDSEGFGNWDGRPVHVSIDDGSVTAYSGSVNLKGKIDFAGNFFWDDGESWIRQ